ncbi:MAG: ABC transporter ATP-binding protein [Spirochaetes bacterium]|nr:ABC transporter ATP-binding protein [Spirochaetota bacterium]
MLHITSLKKKQGAFSLFIESLQIESTGIYGLIGSNGCGKSTLTKLISGIMKPDSGEIALTLGQRDITIITQKPYIMDTTVYNNLAYPLKLRGIKNHKPLCNEYLEKINFLERKNQRAQDMSGGEKQKLALLRAMIFNPKLIILDEAMTDLDIDSLDMFEEMILERQKNNPIFWIIISHQLAHIKRLCDYIFFMSNGGLEVQGPAQEVLRSSNPAVRRYLKHEVLEVENNETINS